MNLKIEGIIEGAERIRQKIAVELPTHSGLAGAVEEVNKAALEAKRVALEGKRFFSLHRLPALFLAFALLAFLFWAYWNFFLDRSITVAIPRQDHREENLRYFRKAKMTVQQVETSSQAVLAVTTGKADVAFIQAGIPVQDQLRVLQTPILEYVIWMTRLSRPIDKPIFNVLTSIKNEGSHDVAKDFFRKWKFPSDIVFHHDWDKVVAAPSESDSQYTIPQEIDAVFVVVNITDEKNMETIQAFLDAGFVMQSPYIGAHTNKLRYTEEFLMPRGYIRQAPTIPVQELLTYSVPNVLVTKTDISDSTLAKLSRIFESDTRRIQPSDFAFDSKDASEVFQGLDAFLGILINIILGFIALLGLEMWVYRKRFHELNSLVSLLSMLQSNKDILGETDPNRRSENLQYLSTVSDLLSMISAINGFYTQEKSSLLFNNQSEVIHQRCDNLKLNIQLKILHAGIHLEPRKAPGSIATQ
jgi:hypothetical protein